MAERERELRELLDKQALTELVVRYARGVDRWDKELVLACFHPDATPPLQHLRRGRRHVLRGALGAHGKQRERGRRRSFPSMPTPAGSLVTVPVTATVE